MLISRQENEELYYLIFCDEKPEDHSDSEDRGDKTVKKQ